MTHDPTRPSEPPTAAAAAPADERDAAAARLCPRCGYDLRGSPAGRCSECGLEVGAAALAVSAVPWAHRRKLGRFRSYFRTAWQAALDAKRLRYELSRPQDARSAATFRRWTAAALAVAFAVCAAVPFLAAPHDHDPMVELAVQPTNGLPGVPGLTFGLGAGGPPRGTLTWAEGFWQDLSVPWSAGATLWPTLPACGLLLAAYLAGASRAAMRTDRLPPDRRAAAEAMGSYAAGPLALLLPAEALTGASALLAVWGRDAISGPVAEMLGGLAVTLVAVVGGALALAGVGATVVRTGQWAARAALGGAGRAVLGAGELLVRWAVGAAVLLGVVPWCVGLIWTMLDALR